MKRIIAVITVSATFALPQGAAQEFFGELTNAQRYDLADAYERVAARFDELGQAPRAAEYRERAREIFPGFSDEGGPEPSGAEAPAPARPQSAAADSSGGDASNYYFSKLLRGVFSENIPLTLSAVAEPLYLPLFDDGVNKTEIASELTWFFDSYDVTVVDPRAVFDMESIIITPLNNGYWRLDVETEPEYRDAVPEVTFWASKMGFYFRRYPEGWRLSAIGPVN